MPAMRRRAGLTLMELLVALAVGGVAISAGYAALAGLVDRRDTLIRATDEARHAAAIRTTLIEWIGGAQLDPLRVGASFRGVEGESDGVDGESAGADDALTFLTAAPTPLGVARTLVTLRIARDSTGRAEGVVAELRDWDGTAAQTLVLSGQVVALDLRYHSTLIASPTLATSWISASVLPAAVELRLGARTGEELPPLLRLPILVPIEATR